MQRHPALPASSAIYGIGTPLQRLGIAGRTAQTLGIEYADSFKKGFDDLGGTWRALAAARSPAEIQALQTAFLNRAGERAAARFAAVGDVMLSLTDPLLRPKAAASGPTRPGPAH